MPADNSLPMSCIHRLHLPLMLVCAAIAASGCAQLPAQQALPPIKTPDAFASAESFRTEPANWPEDQWWTAYGDRQLNTLIDEALQDAPDLMPSTVDLEQKAKDWAVPTWFLEGLVEAEIPRRYLEDHQSLLAEAATIRFLREVR